MIRPLTSPRHLREGDTIAILTPATTVRADYVDRAALFLRGKCFNVEVMPHAKGPADGSFAASHEARLDDFINAYSRTEVRAILCARGGYGAIHLLEGIDRRMIEADPKWIIGFSDISALHALMHRSGIRSVHASMAKHLAEYGDDHITRRLLAILQGDVPPIETSPHPFNRYGHARGVLRGGNLAVLDGLADTPFDTLHIDPDEDVILFLEDISEPIYRVERMLMRLALGSNLQRLKGLIIGQFTEYRPDKNFNTMEEMIDALLRRYDLRIPVAFDFPIGHFDGNLPVVEGAPVSLDVSPEKTVLKPL